MPRTSRKSGAPTPAVQTPAQSRPQRSPSPLSPHRITRHEEQKEMIGLNNRLASYIDLVRSLERDKDCLNQEISTIEEVKTTEIVTLKSNYNNEISKLRKALDDTSIDKAKYEMDSDKLGKENRELKARLKEKERAYDNAAKELRSLQTQYAKVDAENNNAQSELVDLRPAVARLEAKLKDAKRNLEDETLKRVDLQNQLQTSQEGLKFENQLLEQQLNETRVRKQIELSEIDGRLTQEYEDRMAKSLDELREGYAEKLSAHKEELVRNYESKVKNLTEKLQDSRTNSAGKMQMLRELETKVHGFTSINMELEASNTALQKRVNDLVRDMEDAAANYRADIARKDAEVRGIEERLDDLTSDYESLLETKIALDAEIATYNKLLTGEETRLGTSPGMVASRRSMASSGAQTPPGRGVKRKRTTLVEEETTELVTETSSQGDIVIEPLQMDSKCVALRNRSTKEVNIGGWTLSNTTDVEDEEATYKFYRNTALQPNEVCKIFSSDSREEHTPPLNLVMKRGGWTIGERNMTTLVRKDDTEAARCVTKKDRSITSSVRQGYSQLQGSAEYEGDKSNCSIM